MLSWLFSYRTHCLLQVGGDWKAVYDGQVRAAGAIKLEN